MLPCNDDTWRASAQPLPPSSLELMSDIMVKWTTAVSNICIRQSSTLPLSHSDWLVTHRCAFSYHFANTFGGRTFAADVAHSLNGCAQHAHVAHTHARTREGCTHATAITAHSPRSRGALVSMVQRIHPAVAAKYTIMAPACARNLRRIRLDLRHVCVALAAPLVLHLRQHLFPKWTQHIRRTHVRALVSFSVRVRPSYVLRPLREQKLPQM